jgi:hypothetical protein
MECGSLGLRYKWANVETGRFRKNLIYFIRVTMKEGLVLINIQTKILRLLV